VDLSSTYEVLKLSLESKMKTRFNIRLQDGASANIEQFIFVHDHVHIIILIIITPEIYLIIILIRNKHDRRFILEGKIIETI